MIEFAGEIFQYKFLSNAVIACVLSGIACGIIGTYIVCRRLVFLSGGITHSSFGGIGIAYYLGLNPMLGAFVFAICSAMGMEALSGRTRIREDSAIGILWSLGMAVGIIFISLTPGYAPNLMSFLFGNILTIRIFDLWAMVVLDIVIIGVMMLFYRPILYIAFDRDFARTQNSPVGFISYMMMILTGATIVLMIRLAGIVLLISLLSMPPVIANSLTKSYAKITAWAVVISVFATFLGVFISYKADIPSGAATILVLAAVLIIVKTYCGLVKKG